MFFKTRKEIPNESFVDMWFKQVTQMINQICTDRNYLFSRDMTLAIHYIKDKSVQELIAKIKVSCSSATFQNRCIFQLPKYLNSLNFSKYRLAFSKVRLNEF